MNMEDIKWKNRIDQLKGSKVALYGAGKCGKIALENIRKHLPQLEIVCFLDDNKIRNNKDVEGLKVLYLEEAVDQYGDFNILIANYYVSQVLRKIGQSNFDIEHVFYWAELLIEDIDDQYVRDNRDNLQDAYGCLSDNISKMIFKCAVNSRFDKNLDLLARTCEREQYFPDDIFRLNEQEIFVDAGAYEGDTIESFLEHTESKYKYIYAFEPDEANYNVLSKNQGGEGRNISIYHAGLYSESKQILFSSNKGGSSMIEEEGTDTINVMKFDDLDLPEKSITFVKMDIEGSELMALHGMEETIKNYKPKLAICIYHKFEDLWEIPLYIKSLVPEYKLYIRNYTTFLGEIVLYAVL